MTTHSFDHQYISDVLAKRNLGVHTLIGSIGHTELIHSQRPQGYRISKFSFNAFARFENEYVHGCGEDTSCESTAKAKAISELAERLALKIHSKQHGASQTSNGWAAHLDPSSSSINAVFELIERDAAVSHWLTKTPMLVLENALNCYSDSFLQEISNSEFPIVKNLVSFDFAGPVVTTLLMNKNGNVISGHASGPNLKQAIIASTTEACRAAQHFLRYAYFDQTKLMIADENALIASPCAHSLMYAYHQPVQPWIFGPKIQFEQASTNWERKLNGFHSIFDSCQFQILKISDRYIVKAENPLLQSVFWGSTLAAIKAGKINSILRNKIINLQPHLVG